MRKYKNLRMTKRLLMAGGILAIQDFHDKRDYRESFEEFSKKEVANAFHSVTAAIDKEKLTAKRSISLQPSYNWLCVACYGTKIIDVIEPEEEAWTDTEVELIQAAYEDVSANLENNEEFRRFLRLLNITKEDFSRETKVPLKIVDGWYSSRFPLLDSNLFFIANWEGNVESLEDVAPLWEEVHKRGSSAYIQRFIYV